MALKIGLTGGIGNGKTTVAAIFKVLGVPVFDADTAARDIMNEDEAVKAQVVATFGIETYKHGTLDRKYLAGIVFNNPFKLEQLNAIVHPATIAAAEKWAYSQHAPYTIKEAALLFESGSAAGLDYVVGVCAPLPLRIKRVMERDGISRQDVLARIGRQMDEEIKKKLCDFIVVNDEQQLLITQVTALHEKFMRLQKEKP